MSPLSRDPQASKPPARERILRSAIDLFAENGFGNTSIKAIAGRAGVSQGLMYTYFDSKDDLLRAIFEEGMRDVWSTLEPRREDDPVEAVEALLRESFAVVEGHENLWRLLYALRFQPAVVERLSLELTAWSEAIERELAELCARAGFARPEIEARVLFALIDGANQHRVLGGEHYPVEEVIEVIVGRYRKGGGA